MTALELAAAIRQRKIGAVEATRFFLDRIDKNGARVNAFLALTREEALKRAAEAQARIDRGAPASPLDGVPIALKDNIATKGAPTTCASRMLEGVTPERSAEVVEKIEAAGLIVLGKLNMDEFSMGSSSDTGAFGPVRNPWDESRAAGGSSGGSAAAVAAGLVPLALGSDTGGSIRQPCAFCGVTGIKPTYGAVSREGLFPMAPSLDQIGPVARDMDDCAALLSIISGPSGADATCALLEPLSFDSARREDLRGLRVGVPRGCLQAIADEGARSALSAAAAELQASGAILGEFEAPFSDAVIPAYLAISCSEAHSSLSRYDGPGASGAGDRGGRMRSRAAGFGFEAKKRVMLGGLLLSDERCGKYLEKALRLRELLRAAYEDIFRRFDLVFSPVTPAGAHRLGESDRERRDADAFTMPANLAGLCAAALPCGLDSRLMPTGFQLAAAPFREAEIVAAARVFQGRTDWHKQRPPGF